MHFIVQNFANLQKIINLEGTQTVTGIFVDNNGLIRLRTFGNRVTRRGDGCRGEKVNLMLINVNIFNKLYTVLLPDPLTEYADNTILQTS